MAANNRLGGGVSGGGRDANTNTVNITKITTAALSSKKINDNGLVLGESDDRMTEVAPTNSVPVMPSVLTESLHPHCSLLRASVSTNTGCWSMTVRVLVGNRDVSPPRHE